MLADGSLASVPAMYRLWSSTEDPEVKKQVAEAADTIARWYRYDSYPAASLKETNVARSRGIEGLRAMGISLPTREPSK